nr:MAG TPA: hypothetical protein [Caudoviricetes sp.]
MMLCSSITVNSNRSSFLISFCRLYLTSSIRYSLFSFFCSNTSSIYKWSFKYILFICCS